MRVSIIETFVSIQGEGPSVGQPATFLRLAGCNLACEWCDTPFSWDWSRYTNSAVEHVEAAELAQRLLSLTPEKTSLLVVTGGEPMLQRQGLVETLSIVQSARPEVRVEVETNGTVLPGDALSAMVALFVVSPKLANAGKRNLVSRDAVTQFVPTPAVLKFVVRSATDVREAAALAEQAGFSSDRVWIMPEGVTTADYARHGRAVADAAISHGFRISPRLHISIWDDERGR